MKPEELLTSRIENMYLYNLLLLGKLIKGYSLLLIYDSAEAANWLELFTNGNPQAPTDKDYLKLPYIRYQSSINQAFVSKLKGGDDEWVGIANKVTWFFEPETILVNPTEQDLPDNSVIVGFDFEKDENGCLVTVLYRGNLKPDGFVEEIEKVTLDGDKLDVAFRNSRHIFFDSKLLAVPPNSVIIDMSLSHNSIMVPFGYGEAKRDFIYLSVKHARVIDGVIDKSTAVWMDGEDKSGPKSRVYNNGPATHGRTSSWSREWGSWNPSNGTNTPPESWITPLTGVELLEVNKKRLKSAFRTNIHHNSF